MNKDLTNTPGYIYKITSPNNKIYIGQTINKKQRRYHYKTLDFKQQIKLWRNVQKYKWNPVDTFEIIEVVFCGKNKIKLNEREKYWIKYYNSFKDGLNCNEGGSGNIGYKYSEESLKKMSQSKIGIKHPDWRNKQKSEYTKGRKHSAETKKKISLTKRANMNNNIKEKISKKLIGNKNGIGNKGCPKQVKCLNNNKIYNSIIDASKDLKIHSSGIISVCKGKYKQTGGYKFIYNYPI